MSSRRLRDGGRGSGPGPDPRAGAAATRKKLVWRPWSASFHCFVLDASSGYVSLCGRAGPADPSRDLGVCRPPATLRCAACDAAEAARMGWTSSAQERGAWRELWSEHSAWMERQVGPVPGWPSA